ncbi:MAG: acetyl-CoA carboxylase carboxyltransferase subunit alpha [Candidatus Omnitrophica bacterium]|nr:acetyl-CoA carboxylase carboxyltransferase subunit alpha [Candidatus Omnitrophota bacterium]
MTPNNNYLDFEKPILEVERRIDELKKLSVNRALDLSSELKELEKKLKKLQRETFDQLTPWQRVQVARHPSRPYFLDYMRMIMDDFLEIHGDRLYGDDQAIVGGLASLDGSRVMALGHQKGRETSEKLARNFGSAHPEGYRKALRLMKLAERFSLPILSFVDTPGAYPGIGAEERGQAEAIAFNLQEMAQLEVPILIIVIGEGGSGGALGIGVGDVVLILENAYYSVISPEGCAAILWKDRAKAPEAASMLKLTAKDLSELGVIDDVIEEPLGGAHRDPEETGKRVKAACLKHLKGLQELSGKELVHKRYLKFRRMGIFKEE